MPDPHGVFSGMEYDPAGYQKIANIDDASPEDLWEYQFIEGSFDPDWYGMGDIVDPETGLSGLPAGPGEGQMVPEWAPHMLYPGNPIDYTDPGVTGFGHEAPVGNEPFDDPDIGELIRKMAREAMARVGQGLAGKIGQAIPALLPGMGRGPIPLSPQEEFDRGNPFPQLEELDRLLRPAPPVRPPIPPPQMPLPPQLF